MGLEFSCRYFVLRLWVGGWLMRRLSILVIATAFTVAYAQIASSTGSFAADVAAPVLKAPPPLPLPPSWAGFYLGLTGGYGWKQDEFSAVTEFGTGTAPLIIDGVHSKGGVFGGYAGYNWQFGRFVPGIEIDFTATDISGTSVAAGSVSVPGTTGTVSISMGERVKYLGSARARLGWTPLDPLLLYGTAGLAWERVDQNPTTTVIASSQGQNFTETISQQTAADKFGWVAGVGAEVMLGSPNWIARVEYLHYGMGMLQETSISSQSGNTQTAGSQNINVVRGGLAYKFGGEPVWTVANAKALAGAPLSWQGFYIGGHGGYGWGDNPFSLSISSPAATPPTGALSGTTMRGWLAGAQIGYNWQYGRFVTGLEFDLSAADIKGSSPTASIPSTVPGTAESSSLGHHVKYLGTLRGRLGWLPLDNVLLYGTAGLAWERLERNSTDTSVDAASTNVFHSVDPSDHFGWVAGVGGEVMLGSSNWIGRLEYLHYDFGRVLDTGVFSLTQPGLTASSVETAGRQTINVLRAGVSYKFGPQVAAAPSTPLYTKAPPLPAPTQQIWAGFYIGAHGGYGWKNNDFSVSDIDVPVTGIDSRGFVAGGQAGNNWQYGRVVGGVEVDGSATGIQGTSAPAIGGVATETLSDKVKYLGTIRGRLGWTPLNNVLLYGTGGLAWERAHRKSVENSQFDNTIDETARDHFGWAAGAGAEFMLGSSNWIGRLEYLHYDFGQVESSFTFTSTAPGESSAENGGRQTINLVRAGLSYKFTP